MTESSKFEERMKARLLMSYSERLLEAADKLQGQLGDKRYMCVLLAREIMAQAADYIEKLEAENAELRGVLAWYGDETKYDRKEIFDILVGPKTPIANDGGKRARDSIGQRKVKDAE